MGSLAEISKVNKRGGWNKQGGWQKHFAKILAKILLGVCLRKRLDQARNVLLL